MIGELKVKIHLGMLIVMEVIGALVQGPQQPTLLPGFVLPAKLNCTTTLQQGVYNSEVFANRASVDKTSHGLRDIQIGGRRQRPHAAKYSTNRGVFSYMTNI